MSLVPQLLVVGFRKILNPETAPKSLASAANAWSSLYHTYAQGALAGALKPSGLTREVLRASMASGGDFYSGAGRGVQAYWQAAIWTGPGLTGVTTYAGGLSDLLVPIGRQLVSSTTETIESTAQKLAAVLDAYTKSVVITATNVTSGATFPLTLL